MDAGGEINQPFRSGGEIKIKRKIKSTKVGWNGARETANSLIDRSTGACVTHSGAALSLSSTLDVARARAQLNVTLATIPPLEGAISRAIHRLAVLVGQQPTSLVAELTLPLPLPALPPLIALSNPEALLRRRADVRAAERRLAAATARIGVATADLFPRVTFNGSVALQAPSVSALGKSGTEAWSFGPRITWAAFDLGHVRARIQAAGARAEASLAAYERTVLTTLEETENALVDFGREQVRQA